jgi:hypothetical protein
MRLTLRDSLFRLADSASHRAVSAATTSTSGSTAEHPPSGTNASGTCPKEKEKITQMIDRAVANLLYHKQTPPKPEELSGAIPQNQFLGGAQPSYSGYGSMGGGQQLMGPPPLGGQSMMLPTLGGVQSTVMCPPLPREWYWHDTGQGGSQMVSNAQLALPPRSNPGPLNRAPPAVKPTFASRYKRGKAGARVKTPPGKVGDPSAPAGKSAATAVGLGPKVGKAPQAGVPKPKEPLGQPARLSDGVGSSSVGGGLHPGVLRQKTGGAGEPAAVGKGHKHESGGKRDVQGSPKLARSSETGKSGVSFASVGQQSSTFQKSAGVKDCGAMPGGA